ncbi:tetratricopeptide repeat protein, partial [candidate division KSB1 bacterium]|nr:tetratricopeptide repeat protein [candidate division KSB1 bacterium]
AAIDILTSHHFNVWEGGGDIHDVFVDAHLLRGLTCLRSGAYQRAQADFQTATTYPDNLEVGRPIYDIRAIRNHYFIGQSLKLQGSEGYHKHFELASGMEGRDHFMFYKGKALQELAQDVEAMALFDRMIVQGQERLASDEEIDFFAKFGEKGMQNRRRAQAHYLVGLGYYGKGDLDRARAELQKAQSLDINNSWINYYLATVDQSR